jgi:eukaryotic-like serine/threonine-protein kinase
LTNSSGDATKKNGPPSKPAFSPGDIVAGRYRIVRAIGSGGSGEVYEAHDTGLGGTVALKTLKPNLACSAVELERFRREIQNARKVTHFNVCRIFDIGVQAWDGRERFFLTMELLDGKSLAQRLKGGAAYDTDEALPIVTQIVDGLQAAHDAGVVHRDLKPGNIMLLSPSTGRLEPRAVITDFGIALSDEQGDIRLTQSGELVGTPEYMAPEQADLGPALPASDIYAVGLIIYEMLTKRRPFDAADTPLGTVLRRRREPPRPPREHLPDIDPVWEATILRCLEREPGHRFSRAADVAAALRKEIPPTPSGRGRLQRKSAGKR